MQRLLGIVATLAATTQVASADANDLVLSRLGAEITDASGAVVDVVGMPQEFRSVASELGVVLAPRLMAPADTLGFGGFQFTADVAFTGISQAANFWDVRESGTEGVMNTVGFFARKGMWFPLPSFEIGVGAVHLAQSQMWSAQGYAKFALHEGYHDLPLPSLAVRGAVSRAMGTDELDLTVASVDVSVSKDFGIAGVLTLTPYAGWNALIIIPRSEVVDKTPHIDAINDPNDLSMNFVFTDQDNIQRYRMFGGVKLKHYVFTALFELNHAFAGSSKNDVAGTSTPCSMATAGERCDAIDQAGSQTTYSVSLGLDF